VLKVSVPAEFVSFVIVVVAGMEVFMVVVVAVLGVVIIEVIVVKVVVIVGRLGVVDSGDMVGVLGFVSVVQLVTSRACGPPAWKQISSPEPSALKL
jgi:hypothetical protein